MALPAYQLEILVSMLPASPPGALHGSAALWLMACAGAAHTLGRLGAIEALAGVLSRAVDERHCSGAFLLQANWACAALWRLCHVASNAARALACAAPTLLKLLPSSELLARARDAAQGRAWLRLADDATAGAPASARTDGRARCSITCRRRRHGPADQRLTAGRTLDATGPQRPLARTRRQGAAAARKHRRDRAGRRARTCARTACTCACTACTHCRRVGAATRQLRARSARAGASDARAVGRQGRELRALGCRGLARAAQRGAERKIVDAGGTKALTTQLKLAAERYLTALADRHYGAAGASAVAEAASVLAAEPAITQPSANTSPNQPASVATTKPSASSLTVLAAPAVGATPSGSPLEASSSPAACGTLLHDALNAVLNLSGARCAQQQLARYGLTTLAKLWYDTQLYSDAYDAEQARLTAMAGGVLANLACHPANRTLMYRAELQLKTAVCSGMPLKALPPRPGSAQPEENADGTTTGATEDETGGSAAAAHGAEVAGGGGGATGASACGGGGGGATKDGGESKTAKERYVEWLHETMAAVDAEKARERHEQVERERREMEEGSEGTAALARAAFQLIDEDGSGELTRTEVIRAFRLNDRVRELLLPLLPSDLLKSQNSAVSGIDVQAQVEAFEITFQRMDVDGSQVGRSTSRSPCRRPFDSVCGGGSWRGRAHECRRLAACCATPHSFALSQPHMPRAPLHPALMPRALTLPVPKADARPFSPLS